MKELRKEEYRDELYKIVRNINHEIREKHTENDTLLFLGSFLLIPWMARKEGWLSASEGSEEDHITIARVKWSMLISKIKEYKFKDFDYREIKDLPFLTNNKAKKEVFNDETKKELKKYISQDFSFFSDNFRDLKSIFDYSSKIMETVTIDLIVSYVAVINQIMISWRSEGELIFLIENLLNEISSDSRRGSGTTKENKDLYDFIVESIFEDSFEGETTVWDPSFNKGDLLLKMLNKSNNMSAYGQEGNEVKWNIAKIKLFLTNSFVRNKNNELILGIKPINIFDKNLYLGKRVNYAINTTFSSYRDNSSRICSSSNRHQSLNMITKIIDQMTNNKKELVSRGAILISSSIMSVISEQYATKRRDIIECDFVDAVVLLPNELSGSSLSKSILFLNKNKTQNKDKVVFIDIPNYLRINDKLSIKEVVKETSETIQNFRKGEPKEDKKGYFKIVSTSEILKDEYSSIHPKNYVDYSEETINKHHFQKEKAKIEKEMENIWKEIMSLMNIQEDKDSLETLTKKLEEMKG